jgi:hypothetical protein
VVQAAASAALQQPVTQDWVVALVVQVAAGVHWVVVQVQAVLVAAPVHWVWVEEQAPLAQVVLVVAWVAASRGWLAAGQLTAEPLVHLQVLVPC